MIKYTNEIESMYPGLYFDYSVMNEVENKNVWFVELLSKIQKN